jgi:hypothetical protein
MAAISHPESSRIIVKGWASNYSSRRTSENQWPGGKRRSHLQRHQEALLAPLEKARHAWVDELPSLLWSLRTTPNTTTQETPLFLVHGTEVVLPVETSHDSPQVAEYEEKASQRALEDDVDAVDEARYVVLSRVSAYQ